MGIRSIISSGAKVEKFQGPIMKVGAANTMKLSREALIILGLGAGGYAFVADDDENPELFYVAGSQEERTESGAKGSKLGLVGDKDSSTLETANQLQFSHALLGKKLYDVAAVFEISDPSEEGTTFEFDGLTFHTMTIKQTREEYDAEKAEAEAAKQAKVDASEDKAVAARGRVAAE